MLKKKALKKIGITSFILFVILTIYLIPSKTKKNDVEYNYKELQDINVYLLNDNNQLTKVDLKISNNSLEETIKTIINKLTLSNDSTIPNGLKQLLPRNIELLDLYIDEGIVYLNFSENLLKIQENDLQNIIEGVSYSILNLKNINGVSIYINEENISKIYNGKFPSIITGNYGINKRIELKKFDDITKVVIFYIDNIDDKNYYVPVTKYINDERDKIKIIIDELSSNYIYESNLITLLDKNIKLIDYSINNELMTLNFNNSIFLGLDNIVEEVVYSISYSVFSSYEEVETLVFKVNNEKIEKNLKKILNN